MKVITRQRRRGPLTVESFEVGDYGHKVVVLRWATSNLQIVWRVW